jgi:hypothetical protein
LEGSENVTGFQVTASNKPPAPDDKGWKENAPREYTFEAKEGEKFLYAWAKNKEGATNDEVRLSVTIEHLDVNFGPDSGTLITGHQVIVIEFQEDMSSDVELSGTIGTGSVSIGDGGTQNDPIKNGVLTIRPQTGSVWKAGGKATLAAAVTTAQGISFTVNATYNVGHFVCVSIDEGTDTNETDPLNDGGTIDAPLKTIQKGIEVANDLYTSGEVRVAGGTYEIDGATTNPLTDGDQIIMTEGISVRGGYSASDWGTRDSTTHEVILQDASTGAGGGIIDNTVVVFPDDGITAATCLEGFTIQTADYDGSGIICAVYGENAHPELKEIIVEGRCSNTGQEVDGFFFNGGDPVIEGCTVFKTWDGPQRANWSSGVYILDGSGSDPAVQSSEIHGGDAAYSYGIYTFSSQGTFTGNDLFAGKGSNGAAALVATNSDCSITLNTMTAGERTAGVANTTCITLSGTATPIIDENTFFFPDTVSVTDDLYAVQETGDNADPASLSDNSFDTDFEGVGVSNQAYYYDYGETSAELKSMSATVTLSGESDTLANYGNDTFAD